jgi:hypothetical protein
MRPGFTAALFLLICVALPYAGCARDRCSFTAPATVSGPVVPEGFGVNIHFTDPRPGEIKLLAEAGFRWVRMDFIWADTEKEPGRYDFSAYDRLLTALEPYKIHALFILDYRNSLYDHGAPPRSEATRQAFARWGAAAAKHFAGRGIFWEIYNEPNQPAFWPPQPNAQEYAALALAVGRAFREAAPREKLIGPATLGIDFSFAESCFKAGLLEYWSAVSVHPYRQSEPETAAAGYCRLREMIKTYAAVATPGSGAIGGQEVAIISSEWGYSSAWRGSNEEEQGKLLARSWLTNLASGVSLSIWYDWRDDGADPNEAEHHFGVVANSYHPEREPVFDLKPSYFAAQTLATVLRGYRFEKRIESGAADDYVLAFRNGGDWRFAAWTTEERAHTLVVPVAQGSYALTGHNGKQTSVVNAERNGLTIAISTAPVYIQSR